MQIRCAKEQPKLAADAASFLVNADSIAKNAAL
jgi:hypothetical protein